MHRVNIRSIAATNRDLEKLLRQKRFREDLYYRLNVVPITIPPLRARPADIPRLIQALIEHFCSVHGQEVKIMHPDALDCLLRYPFPGNIRELENILERIVITVEDRVILPEHLPEMVLSNAVPPQVPTAARGTSPHPMSTTPTTGSRIDHQHTWAERLSDHRIMRNQNWTRRPPACEASWKSTNGKAFWRQCGSTGARTRSRSIYR